eukprot:2057686-Prorocentrum_lima.AAC.1
MQAIQDTENRLALEPIRDFDDATTLPAREELQEATTFLHATGEEKSHQKNSVSVLEKMRSSSSQKKLY